MLVGCLYSSWLRWPRICLWCRKPGFNPWVRKIPQRRKWLPTPVFLPGGVCGQRSLVGYSPQGGREVDAPEQLTLTHRSLESCLFTAFADFFFLCWFLIGFLLLLLSFSSLHILHIKLLSDKWFADILSHSIGCLFPLLIPFLCRGF